MAILQLQQQNVSAAAAYTEYSVAIPPAVNEVTLALRGNVAALFWYMASHNPSPGSAANLPTVYGTIPAGASRTIRGKLGGQTIYFQTDTAAQTLEVDYYGDT